MTDLQLAALMKMFREGAMERDKLKGSDLRGLIREGLVEGTSQSYFALTRRGRSLLINEHYIQLIDMLAMEYEGQTSNVFWSKSLRVCINQIMNRLPASKLTELLTHKCKYIQKRARIRMANIALKAMGNQADKRLARALLTWGNPTIEAALTRGLEPTIEDAVAQWREELLSLDHMELVTKYIEARLQLNSSFSKQVLLLRGPFKRLAEKFLNEGGAKNDNGLYEECNTPSENSGFGRA